MKPGQHERNERALAAGQSKDNLGAKAMRGGAAAFGGQIGGLIIHIVGAVIMARLLNPADFGLIAMAGTVTVFVGLFKDMGLSAATIQRPSVSQELVSTLFYVNLFAGLGLMLLAVAAAPVAAWGFGDPRILVLVIALAVAIPIAAATAQHNALLARAMRWRALQTISLGSQFAGLMVGIGMAWVFEAGHWALVGQAVTIALSALILSWTNCKWRPSWIRDWRNARAEIGFGLNVSGFNFLNYFHRQFDNVLIGWRWGPLEIGYYSRAYSLLTLPITLVNNAMSQVAVPILSKLKETPHEWNRAFLQMSTVTAFASAGLCVLLLVGADPLIRVLLGEKWTPVIDIFRFLSLSSIIATGANACGWIFMSLGKSKELLRWSLFASPLYVLSFVIGLPWKGSGVALAYAIATAILSALYYVYALRQTTLRKRTVLAWLGPVYCVALLAIVAGFSCLSALQSFPPLAKLIICSTVVAVVYVSGGFICLTKLPHYQAMKIMLFAGLANQWASLRGQN
jgi:polysaccharide transporter, PST family